MRKENNIYSRTVEFRDEDKNAWSVEINLYKESTEGRGIHYETLEPVAEVVRFSACGEGGNCCGQCQDHIKPRTEAQRKLLWMWNEYHMNDLRAGTKAQSDYINSDRYKHDYDTFVSLFKDVSDKDRGIYTDVTFLVRAMKPAFGKDCDYPMATMICYKYLTDNAVRYILGYEGEKRLTFPSHDLHDLYTRYFFLALRGLLTDRGYKYGSAWLVNPLPDDIERQIDDLCDKIEEEEDELTEQLEAVFDMGADEFAPTDKIIQQVVELRDCDEDEARHFLALGMHLECTFGDLNDTFENIGDHLYKANGVEYYIGTDEELESIAKDIVNDDEYAYLWREAVAAERTEQSLVDWCNSIIEEDGWCSVLNHWDGRYNEYCIGDNHQYICVSRT